MKTENCSYLLLNGLLCCVFGLHLLLRENIWLFSCEMLHCDHHLVLIFPFELHGAELA